MNDEIKKMIKKKLAISKSNRGKIVYFWNALAILFGNCLDSECFPKEWRKAKVVPAHKNMINN